MNKLELVSNMMSTMQVRQKEVADKIGISNANFSRIMQGKVSIEKHYDNIIEVFEEWKELRVIKLKEEIKKLNHLSKKCANVS